MDKSYNQFLLFLCCCVLLNCNHQIQSTIVSEVHQELQATLNEFSTRNEEIFGNIVSVEIPGHVDWSGAYGYFDLDYVRPIRIDDSFLVLSSTKTFIATLIIQLVEENTIYLDSLIYDYLPEGIQERLLNIYDPNITVRQVLSHRSGFREYHRAALRDLVFNNPDKMWIPDELLEHAVYKCFQVVEPGMYYESNTNYLILGIVLEHLYQARLNQIIKNKLCSPLNLGDTYLHSFDPKTKDIAHGYYWDRVFFYGI